MDCFVYSVTHLSSLFTGNSITMAQRCAAVYRRVAASREGTPTHSRTPSRSTSREALNYDSVADETSNSHRVYNDCHVLMNGNRSSSYLAPLQDERNGQREWYSSSSNLTSTDSTPSSDHTTDSGQVTDSSPLTGPLASLGFPQSEDSANTCLYRMPIVGYEVLEERSRFTVFKIQVLHQPTGDQWFVFRRYTDFVRLNRRLKTEFPGLRFALPPKRWFGDNFDPIFLEDRQLGLQVFIDNIIGHTRIREKKCVRDFFCLDDPPGTHDTLEESRAMCQTLEDNVADLQAQLRERDGEIAVLQSQVNFLMAQQHTLVKALRLECELQGKDPYSHGSTHDLNLALLSIFGVRHTSGDSTLGFISKQTSVVKSPFQRTLEKAFLTCSDSRVALESNCHITGVINSHNLVETHSETVEDQ
ncbi:hypothetical protein OTU49_005634 [Cherax quadricarinatus]|uniref:PX domain-containing protein n=1 Tax=Cherax quadricarinatus TaxID=27406 RepID=A0AAW0X6J8_CHEQU